jgi:hypothetical protein
MTRPLAAALAALALASPALAAETKAGADELAKVLMPRKTWDDGLNQLAQNVQGRMQMHPGKKIEYPADFPKKVRAELEAALPYDVLVGIHAKQLAASYSEAELKDLLAFYRSPTGQKSLQTMPAVSEKVAMETQQRVESKMPEIMSKLSSQAKMPAGGAPKAPAGHGMPAKTEKPAAKPAAPATPAKPAATK